MPACSIPSFEQALHRDVTIEEALALIRAFAAYLTATRQYLLSEPVDKASIIPQPLLYTLVVCLSPESIRATHLAITLIVVRAAKSLTKSAQPQWTRWITLMLWICIPKDPRYFEPLQQEYLSSHEAQHLLDKIEMSLAGLAVEHPHVEEIARILWPPDDEIWNLISDAFKDPERLVSDFILPLSVSLTCARVIWSSCFTVLLNAILIAQAHNMY
jgi:hypothetical protein